jgi:uncharacterized protein (DUF2062 family)
MGFKKLRERFHSLLHLEDSAHSLALSFGVGVFIAFCPLVGFHTVLAFFFIWLFRLNMVALFLGAFLNNPWTIFPIMGGSLWLGTVFYPVGDSISSIHWSSITSWGFFDQFKPYVIPFFIGSTVLGVVSGLIGYVVALYLIELYRDRIRLAREKTVIR